MEPVMGIRRRRHGKIPGGGVGERASASRLCGPGEAMFGLQQQEAQKGSTFGPGNWVRLASSSSVEFVSGRVPSVVMNVLHEYHSTSEKDDAFKLMNSPARLCRPSAGATDGNAFVLGRALLRRRKVHQRQWDLIGTPLAPSLSLIILAASTETAPTYPSY